MRWKLVYCQHRTLQLAVENKVFEGKIKRFKKGELIVKPDEEIKHVYFLREGLVRQYWVSDEGDEIIIHFFKPGSLLPIMLLFAKKPNRYYFEAFSDVSVQELSAGSTLAAIKNNPALLLEFSEKFSLAITGLSLRIEFLASKKVSSKILLFIDYLAKSFGETNKEGEILINLKLTHSEIASWIGASRETVTREIVKLAKSNSISFAKGKFKIENKSLFLKQLKGLRKFL